MRPQIRYSPESIQVVVEWTAPYTFLCNPNGNRNVLYLYWNDDGNWLNAYYDNPDNKWNRDNGFVFVVSQV